AAARTTPVPRPKRGGNGNGRKRRGFLWRWRRSLFVVGLTTVAVTGGAASVFFNIALPPEDPLRQTSFVCTADVTEACGPDNAIATFSAEEDRTNVRLDEVPQVLVDAVLATEDRDFFAHGGVDPVGIGRALYNDIRGRGVQQGGSTITQQYVKNVYLNSDRTITRKIKEAVLAVKLERELDKEQILGRYLNTIYFGRGAYGVAAASRAYFGKDVRTIGVAESAYLAGLIRAPEAADARSNPEEATRRLNVTLAAMLGEGMINADERAVAADVAWDQLVIPRRDRSKLDIDPELEAIGGAYFLEAVRRQIEEKYGAAVLYGGGLRIYLTLDPGMQKDAWDAVNSTLDEPDDPAAALVAVDDQGKVRAMVGGRDFETQKVNYALGKDAGGSGRGAGSSFKPFVLATAIREGISLNSKFSAPSKMTFPKADNGKDWVVGNYEDAEQGTLDLVDATRVSSNTAYSQLMLEVGPEKVVDLAHDLGVQSDLSPVPSLVLGTSEVSPLDMAVGFSTFANRGVRNDPKLIERIEQVHDDGELSILAQARPTNDRVLTEAEADQVTHALRQVVTAGTGRSANFGKAAAGKTGTTNDNRDAWFVGYTPKLTAAVWMGYDNKPGEPTRYMEDVHGIDVTGGSLPAQIWNKFMRNATEGEDQGSFVTPKSFPGEVLNAKLVLTPDSTTSTTVDPDAPTTTVDPDAPTSSSSSIPGGSTTTKPTTTSTVPTTTSTLPKCTVNPPTADPNFPYCQPTPN
ncbi:MAG: PBP1A family penicillin-binding protein, partial [Actinomycetota bacterium]|nr:PBP1A family penicillin-binding protein [Actinomycetota bacterium]